MKVRYYSDPTSPLKWLRSSKGISIKEVFVFASRGVLIGLQSIIVARSSIVNA